MLLPKAANAHADEKAPHKATNTHHKEYIFFPENENKYSITVNSKVTYVLLHNK